MESTPDEKNLGHASDANENKKDILELYEVLQFECLIYQNLSQNFIYRSDETKKVPLLRKPDWITINFIDVQNRILQLSKKCPVI